MEKFLYERNVRHYHGEGMARSYGLSEYIRHGDLQDEIEKMEHQLLIHV